MGLDADSVLRAAHNEGELTRLIEENRGFILREASSACRRFLTEEDDEWSIALSAFVRAIRDYDPQKGSFSTLARLLIRRRLIDYYRSQKKFEMEIPATPALRGDPADDPAADALRTAVAKKLADVPNTADLVSEIQTADQLFSPYGFTLFDLSACSPKASKTRASCAKATRYLLRNPMLLEEMRRTRTLPLKILEKNAEVPRKILERHRKYLIAAAEILSGDFPGLAAYLHFVKEEGYG